MKISKMAVIIVLTLSLLVSASIAEGMDLSSLSYAELQQMKDKIDAEMVMRPEWPGVFVPSGVYKVGEDIPEGFYSIRLCDQNQTGHATVWGYAVNDYVTNGGAINPMVFGWGTTMYGKVELKTGWLIEISGDCYFAPPIKLGF